MRTLLAAFCLLLSVPVLAADTTEPFDMGATNLEFYTLVEGADRASDEQTLAGEMVMGWAVAPRFSSYIATSLAADGSLVNGETAWAVGALGNLRDGARLDLDVMLDISTAGHGNDPLCVCPGLELNLDGTGRGLYLRGNLVLSGQDTDDGAERRTDLAAALGTYLDLAPGHQLLLEYHASRAHARRAWETSALALGYNADLGHAVELISEVALGVASDGGPSSLNLTLGFIATLPGGAAP